MMNAKSRMPRKIFLAHGDRKTLSILESILRSLGHELTLVTTLGRELIDATRRNPPQMFISSPKLEDMDGIDALLQIGEFRPTPAIIVARDDDLRMARHPAGSQDFVSSPRGRCQDRAQNIRASTT